MKKQTEKICIKCLKEKPINEFDLYRKNMDNLIIEQFVNHVKKKKNNKVENTQYCKCCQQRKDKKYFAKNSEICIDWTEAIVSDRKLIFDQKKAIASWLIMKEQIKERVLKRKQNAANDKQIEFKPYKHTFKHDLTGDLIDID